MAVYAAIASGNWTDSTIWGTVDSTSYTNNETTTTALTTSYVTSSTFSPGALTLWGIAVKVAFLGGTAGQLFVALDQAGATVAGTETQINLSDVVANNITGTLNYGWLICKFSAPVSLPAAATTIKAKISAAASVSLYATATTNWNRLLITTTTATPTTGDTLIVGGYYNNTTSTASAISQLVTMDNTSAVQYGGTASGAFGLEVCKLGILTWGSAANTNYYLKMAGRFDVYPGSVYNQGTLSTPTPSGSSHYLELVPNSNVDTGIEIRSGAMWNQYGIPINMVKTILNADVSAAGTSLTTLDNTGWKNGDAFCIASTSRTANECEKRVLTADATSNTLTITGSGLTFTHSGTNSPSGDTRAELGNLTRNNRIYGTTSALQSYLNFAATSTGNISYAEFYNIGSATTNKRGITVATTTGVFNFLFNSIHDCTVASSIGLNITANSGSNINISNSIMFNIANSHILMAINSGTVTVSGNLCIRTTDAGSAIITSSDISSIYINNITVGAVGIGFTINEGLANINIFSSNIAHSNGTYGLSLTGAANGTISNNSSWRNGSAGFIFNTSNNLTIDSLILFGNVACGIDLITNSNLRFTSPIIQGGVSAIQPIGVRTPNNNTFNEFYIDNGIFGSPTTHTTADFQVGSATISAIRGYLYNTLLNSGTEVSNQNTQYSGFFLRSTKHDQQAGNHKTWFLNGIITSDSSIFRNSSLSERLTPNNASSGSKLESGLIQTAISSGDSTKVLSVWVRKSSALAGDTAYNGNQPRLVLKKNVALGYSSDTVLATASAPSGIWEQLIGSIPAPTDDGIVSIVVDCNGTAGWINIDDAATTSKNNVGTNTWWVDGLPGSLLTASNVLTHPGMGGGFRG